MAPDDTNNASETPVQTAKSVIKKRGLDVIKEVTFDMANSRHAPEHLRVKEGWGRKTLKRQ